MQSGKRDKEISSSFVSDFPGTDIAFRAPSLTLPRSLSLRWIMILDDSFPVRSLEEPVSGAGASVPWNP